MNKIIKVLKNRIVFIFTLVLLNLYCSFVLYIFKCYSLNDAVIMLMFANDKIIERLKKVN